jgi:ATP-dependent DNA ligase
MGLQMNLSDLEMECSQRGLRVAGSGKNGKVQKIDYLKALEGFTLAGLRSRGLLLPGCEWVHAHLESPMLAQSQTCFKSEALFQDFVGRSSVLAEIKADGCRLVSTFYPGVGFEFFSRNRSVTDYLFGQYSNQVYGLTQEITRDIFPVSFVLDSELVSLNPSVNGHVVTDSVLNAVVAMLGMNQLDSFRMQAEAGYPLRFQTFDILQYDGESVMDRPLRERKQLLHEVMVKLWEAADRLGLPQLKWFQEVETVYGGLDVKLDYYKKVTGSGGEGLILKDVDSLYNPREARGGMGAGWLKMKRSVSESLGRDVDCFVTGFSEGLKGSQFEWLVGSLEFSVYLVPSGEKHVIAHVSGIPESLRRSISVVGPDGKVGLDPKCYGWVAAITGQDVSTRSRSFAHAKIVRWRTGADAKLPHDCVMQEADLNALVL